MTLQRGTRRRIAQATAIVAFAALFILILAALFHEQHIDINSGRESRALSVGAWTLSRRPYDTPLSTLLRDTGWQPPPPDWRRAFTTRHPSGARVNHRYGGIVTSARHLPSILELEPDLVSVEDRTHLAHAVIALMQRGEKFIIGWDRSAGRIEMLDEDGQILRTYPAK